MTRYTIIVGRPWQRLPDPRTASEWGWSHTLDRAMHRAERLSLDIRTDCAVGVACGGRLLAVTGVHGGPGGISPRPPHPVDA